jgi:cytochrome P450
MYLATRPNPSSYNIFNIVDKQIHRARRRIVGQGMNKRAVHRFDPVLQEQVTIFLRHLLDASMKDQAVDMSERCGLLGLDISGELGFGRSFDLQTDTRNAWMSKGIETQTWRLNTYVQFPAIRYSGWEKLLLPVVLPQVRRYHRMIKDMIDARLCIEKDARPDLFASVSDFKDPQTGEGIDKLQLFAEANFLISAGMSF